MKKLILYLVLIVFVLFILPNSCMVGDQFEDCGGDRPLNKLEQKLLNELSNKFEGHVEFDRVNFEYRDKYINRKCYNSGNGYAILMKNWTLDQLKDSVLINNMVKNTTLNIHENILEDSIRKFIWSYAFYLSNDENVSNGEKRHLEIVTVYKKDIENFLGEKIKLIDNKLVCVKTKKLPYLKLHYQHGLGSVLQFVR